MWGKGALIAAVGFTMIFSVYKINLANAVFSTDGDLNIQFIQLLVEQAAVSGANFGITKAWKESWNSGSLNFVEEGCSVTVSATTAGSDTLIIKSVASRSLLDKHHYALTGQSLQIKDSVIATFRYSQPASRYFWFTEDEGGYQYWNMWLPGDTVRGPIYSRKFLHVAGSPVFYGKVTAYKGIYIDPVSPWSSAKYYGGWEVGMKIDRPTNTVALVNAANAGNGGAPVNTKSVYNKKVQFHFQADGSVIRTVENEDPDTVQVTAIAPTGAIYSTKSIGVKGIFNGQLSIYSTDDIRIEDDLVYADDPVSNPNSDDILGLIAGNDIWIADNAATQGAVTLQACLLAINGSFKAQNWDSRAPAGELSVYGSIIQKNRGRVGVYYWWSNDIETGFKRNYAYDTRLVTLAPPYYPTVSHMRLVSWWQ